MNIYFIHIPKTGGTYIQDEYYKETNIKKHIGIGENPILFK